MAIDTSNLTIELGKIFGALNEINTFRGTTAPARIATLRTAYGTDAYDLLNGLAVGVKAGDVSMDTFVDYYSQLAIDTIFAYVNADRVVPFTDINDALIEWNRQLVNAVASFNDCPVTLTKANVGSPTADYTFVTNVKDGFGKAVDFGIPDVLLLTVEAAADNGGTRWAETLRQTGKAADSKVTDASYPTGTGIFNTFSVIDPDTNSGSLTDGSFNNYTSGAFTSWTRGATQTSANSVQVASDYRNGASGFAANLISDGTLVSNLTQTVSLTAATTYTIYFVVKVINAAMTTAKVHVSLRRVDTGAIVADAAGSNLTVSSTSMATIGVGSWAKFSAVFCSPQYIPAAGLYLDIRLADGTTVTSPATVATAVYVDHVSMQEMTPLYDGGPSYEVFSGIVTPLVTDQWTVTTALASSTVPTYMLRWLDRTVGLASRTFRLPSVAGGGETIVDSLIG